MKTLISLSVLILAAVSSPAIAHSTVMADGRVQVRIGDLDISTVAGAAALDRRIDRAARSACAGGLGLQVHRCRAMVRNDLMDALPVARRQDYARARGANQV
ncbi:MAG: UrcA family protein [Brevundimonas sp.]|uniref:UrcA family protein n=1 Tax=Brevundimonas sp. TaxID=1871086 RepID=UPI001A2810D0|nr:UrcA family protein [Brevundimonas sp.]MBJ7446303.1 UrcA family protein [Brevundimonas sp.]